VERRGRGDERGKKAVKEGGKEGTDSSRLGSRNGFYFKHSLKCTEATDDTSQLQMLELNTVAPSNTVRVTHKPTNTIVKEKGK
jgi:hypothetical protein